MPSSMFVEADDFHRQANKLTDLVVVSALQNLLPVQAKLVEGERVKRTETTSSAVR